MSWQIIAKCSRLLQKLNHFTGMLDLCRKRSLARSIATMAQHMPQHYAFCPRTFVLPEQAGELGAELKAQRGHKRQRRTYIVKPDSGCQVLTCAAWARDQQSDVTQKCISLFRARHPSAAGTLLENPHRILPSDECP